MPAYAKVVNGQVEEIGPEPDSFTLPDPHNEGEFVSVSTPTDTPTDPKILREAGYLPVEDHYEENADIERAVQYGEPTVEVMKTKVVRSFALEDSPVAEPDPLATRVVALDDRVSQLELNVAHYQPMIEQLTRVGPIEEMDARALYGALLEVLSRVQSLETRIAELEA